MAYENLPIPPAAAPYFPAEAPQSVDCPGCGQTIQLAQNLTASEARRMERAIDRGDDNTIIRYRRLMNQRGIDPDTIPILQMGTLPQGR